MRVEPEARRRIYDALGLSFFQAQYDLVMNTVDPFLIFAGGVGAGKSMTAARYLIPELLLPNRIFWIVAADFTNGRMEFDWTVRYVEKMGLEYENAPSRPQDGEWWFRLKNGTELRTKSARHHEGLHSVPVDGIICAEAGQLTQWVVEERCIPRITRTDYERNPGGEPGWILFCGTFEGSNAWMSERYYDAKAGRPGWAAYTMATWDNTLSYPGGRDDPKIKIAEQELPFESFMQRYGAVPMSPAGVVYKEFSKEHHVTTDAEFDPQLPVQIWVDPGRFYAVCAIQLPSDERRQGHVVQFDEIYLNQGTTDRCITELVSRPWFRNVMGGWIDVEASEPRTVWSNGAIWRTLSLQVGMELTGFALNAQKVDILPGIERVRTFLHSKVYDREHENHLAWQYGGQSGISRYHVNPRCLNTIREFQSYAYPANNQVEALKPRDEFNHALKAIGYGIVGNFGLLAPFLMNFQSVYEREIVGMTR